MEEIIIERLRMYMMFNLSIYDAWTERERVLYGAYQKGKKAEVSYLKEVYQEELNKYEGKRVIGKEKLYKEDGSVKLNKVIAGFENEAVRLCDSFKNFQFSKGDASEKPLVTEFIILDCDNDIIRNQIVDRGITINEKDYMVYSSSANQQKKKQVLLMEESFYCANESKLLCGLTLDAINQYDDGKGNRGCNTGKYLAYTSLIFSKSYADPVPVNIGEVIVLPEFETYVDATVNYLDMDTQVIETKKMKVPVNHMDGAGFFLPGLLPQSCQIRSGWIKGAVFPFDFRQFIIEKQQNGKIMPGAVIKDVWGNNIPIDYVRDHVKLVLNGSQLKMWKYYASWEQYKEAFKVNNLHILVNNMLHYPGKSVDPVVQSAYQFYQTISRKNVTNEKIEQLCDRTIGIINDYRTKTDKILEIMGIDADAKELDPYFASIKLYPGMSDDPYTMGRVSSKIKKIRKTAMSGKPFIEGFYNYICPDLYAACEYWFCGEENSEGLVPEGHVYNGFYDNKEVTEVCCLRSPHLSDCEHGIRQLVKSDDCKKWFHGYDTVISIHDLFLLTLQADVDGDETLITPDRAFIDLLDREKYPLYYEMKKADPMEVNNENIKKGLKRSFENSQIGYISNSLTKHWNKQDEPDLDFVRVLTAYNNFCIDNPKSQYMPELNPKYNDMYEALKNEKCPWFFKYAKDKKTEECENYTEDEKSNVNRIAKYIMDATRSNKENRWDKETDLKFNPMYFQIKDFVIDRKSDTYLKLWRELDRLKGINNIKFNKMIEQRYKNDSTKKSLFGYVPYYCYCNNQLLKIVEETYKITEKVSVRKKTAAYLLDVEYFQEENTSANKDILWNCFGDILYDNLKKNLENEKRGQEIKKCYRNAYQSRDEREKQAEKDIAEQVDLCKKEKEIEITLNEYKYISELPHRKGCERDIWLLFLLLVLYKRKLKYLEDKKNLSKDDKENFRIYKNSRYGKLTRATLDTWMDNCTVAKKGLLRLEERGLIRVEETAWYSKVYPLFIFEIGNGKSENDKVAFVVKEPNPMINYFEYTGERTIKVCDHCKEKFIMKPGNHKTCSPKCSRKMELLNKNQTKN